MKTKTELCNEIKKALSNMELGEEITIYGLDGNDGVPNLAMGVMCEQYFDSDNTTYLCGVYGSDSDFTMFREMDYEYIEDLVKDIVDWFFFTAKYMIGSSFNGISLTNE